MKIAILTQPLDVNYGGLLQAYALQTLLRQMGHDVWIIDRYPMKPKIWIKAAIVCKRIIKRYILQDDVKCLYPYKEPTAAERAIIYGEIDHFIERYIQYRTQRMHPRELYKNPQVQKFDIYIVGSDQVWRPKFSHAIKNDFLDFVRKSNAKKIAYAASFGTDLWEFSPCQTRQCRNLAQKFDLITVREESGLQLCRDYLQVSAHHVLDPTMLLNPENYFELFSLPRPANNNGSGILTYILDKSELKFQLVKHVEELLQQEHLSAMPSKIFNRENQHDMASCKCISPVEWIQRFATAGFIITDSFHGCVFAIIFNRPFIAIGNNARGLTRFTSLLKMFVLENRLVYRLSDITDSILHAPIDWEQVNRIREEKKAESIRLIKSTICHE